MSNNATDLVWQNPTKQVFQTHAYDALATAAHHAGRAEVSARTIAADAQNAGQVPKFRPKPLQLMLMLLVWFRGFGQMMPIMSARFSQNHGS